MITEIGSARAAGRRTGKPGRSGPGTLEMRQVERRQPVQQAGGEHHPGGPRGQGGRREVADLVDQALRDDRLLGFRHLGRWRARSAAARPGRPTFVGSAASMAETLLPMRALAGRVADRDRDHRDERRVRQRTVIGKPAPQRAGAHGHHHVVDRDAEGVLHRLDGVQIDAAEREPAVRRDGLVERRRGRPAQRGRDDLAVAAVQPEHAADQRVHRRGEGRQDLNHLVGQAHGLDRPPGRLRGRSGRQLGPARGLLRAATARPAAARARPAQVEQDGQQLGA